MYMSQLPLNPVHRLSQATFAPATSKREEKQQKRASQVSLTALSLAVFLRYIEKKWVAKEDAVDYIIDVWRPG